MKWRDKYNEFRDHHDWQQYETRDKIDDVIVNKLSELLEEQEAKIEQLQDKSSNSDYVKLPELPVLIKELENTGWLNPEYKDGAIEQNRYMGVEVVLNVIKRLGNFA